MSIDNIISSAVAEALKSLYGADVDAATIVPQTTKKEFEGNLTIVVFPFLKMSKKAPEATAQEIAQQPAGLQPFAHYGGKRLQGGKDQHRQRPRHTHLQVDARLAEMGQRSDS